MTYYLDELKPGMSETLSRQVSERDVQLFGEATGDMNPVHFDEEYARGTIFRGRVIHGMLTGSLISAVLGTRIPGPGCFVVSLNVEFKAPVRIGDTVTTTCTLREIVKRRRAVFDCVCRVGDNVVLQGEAVVVPPSRPK